MTTRRVALGSGSFANLRSGCGIWAGAATYGAPASCLTGRGPAHGACRTSFFNLRAGARFYRPDIGSCFVILCDAA